MRKVRLRDLISGVCRDRKVLFGFGGVGVGRGGVLPGMLRRCEVVQVRNLGFRQWREIGNGFLTGNQSLVESRNRWTTRPREEEEQSWASGKPNPGLPWVGIGT